jgi:hypothetical protein
LPEHVEVAVAEQRLAVANNDAVFIADAHLPFPFLAVHLVDVGRHAVGFAAVAAFLPAAENIAYQVHGHPVVMQQLELFAEFGEAFAGEQR